MLRITVVPSADGALLLHLSGRIGAAEVEVLEAQLEQHGRHRQALDLAAVQVIDEVGLCLLERWTRRGLELRGGSPFLRRLLEERRLPGAAPSTPS